MSFLGYLFYWRYLPVSVTMCVSLLEFAIGIALLYFLYRKLTQHYWLLLPFSSAKNPFSKPSRKRKGASVVMDRAERDRVLKQNFNVDLIPKRIDAIVIGSGIGGLTTAGILAKTGKSVLVLEQHDQAGGSCHTYIERGFEFDVGIHYIGQMKEGSVNRVLIDELTESGVEWAPLEEIYDTVMLGMEEDEESKGEGEVKEEEEEKEEKKEKKEKKKRREYPVHSGKKEFIASLLEQFPSEKKAIEKYFEILKQLRWSNTALGLLKLLPISTSLWLISSGLLRRWFPSLEYYSRSLSSVLNELTDNKDLKAVLAYSYGDYGTVPKDASFGMQAILTNHFMFGGYYPVGGSSQIAFHIIPTIEAAGGRVLVRAPVTNILMDKHEGEAVGVSVRHGGNCYDILAPIIISDAGIMNTFRKLLPQTVIRKYSIKKQLLSHARNGLALMSVFIGLDGTKEELGLKASNVWLFKNENFDETMEEYLKTEPEDVNSVTPPLMFISFPSTKDPTYNARFPGKSTCAVITATPYEWFSKWRDEPVLHRGMEYEMIKKSLVNKMTAQLVNLFPQLDGRIVYINSGTPLSNIFYLGSDKGDVYGIDHDTKRFSFQAIAQTRPDVGIPGLYLTGQDVMTCGFTGAMYGGLFCAMTILRRNLVQDLSNLTKRIKKDMKDKKQ